MFKAVTGQPLQYSLHTEAAAGDGSPPLHRMLSVGRAHVMH